MIGNRQPEQLMCIYCGATRKSFYIPPKENHGGLMASFMFSFDQIMTDGLTSTIPETRAFWEGKLLEMQKANDEGAEA